MLLCWLGIQTLSGLVLRRINRRTLQTKNGPAFTHGTVSRADQCNTSEEACMEPLVSFGTYSIDETLDSKDALSHAGD